MGVRGTTYRDVVVLALLDGPATIAELIGRIDEDHWRKALSEYGWDDTIALGQQNVRTRLLNLEKEGWTFEDDGRWRLRTPAQREAARVQVRRDAEPGSRVLGLVDQVERESGLKLRLEVRERAPRGKRSRRFGGEYLRVAVLVTERGEVEYTAPDGMEWVELVRRVVPA